MSRKIVLKIWYTSWSEMVSTIAKICFAITSYCLWGGRYISKYTNGMSSFCLSENTFHMEVDDSERVDFDGVLKARAVLKRPEEKGSTCRSIDIHGL